MSDINPLFMTATREKYRFPSVAGQLSVEDLWDLPLSGKGANLDNVAKALHKELKEAEGEISFVKPAVKTTAILQAKFDIVKHVIETVMAERDARAAAQEKAATKQKLLAKLAEKQDKALDDLTPEQIQAMVDSL